MIRRRHAAAALGLGATAVLASAAGSCVPHPVGPARSERVYESKGVDSAETALSSVETVRVLAGAAADDRSSGPSAGVVVSGREDSLDGAAGSFASIQPPGPRSDELRAELGDLLDDALEHVAAVRVAVRRGRLARLDDVARPLADDAAALRRFIEEHRR